MIKTRIKIAFMTGVVGLATLIAGENVGAETMQQSMTISPPTQRMILMPGETYTNSIKVSNANDSTRDLEYSVTVGSFSENGGENGKDDYGVVDHVSVSSYNQIMDWISFDKESGTVAPNSTDIVTYTINVPENAPAGGQYATIIVRDETGKKDSGEGNVAIQSIYQFASIIYAQIAGQTIEDGLVTENYVPTFLFGGPLTTSSIVANNGNVHTDAKYTLEVKPLFSDEEVYSNIKDPMTSLILPGTERYNTQTWDGAPMIGVFNVKQTVEIFGNISTNERTVIFCPLWLLFIILFVVILIIIWLVSRGMARRKRA